ncbi:hypothetical protein SCNU_05970 [Gordonia neofelifaecis NRRL B-59395]|uniref:SGNH hydrolase-type esterase domain-containing protein n=2 Tax=Gordonia TaxID=2053 RepID=F1YHC6_9ACTN|nr:hypothetical protein SCNU_05970 [Gordonia neofelifaecis NRRL B-59395]
MRRGRRAAAVLAATVAVSSIVAPAASAKTDAAGTLDVVSRVITQELGTQRGFSDTMFDVPSYLWMLTHPQGSGTKNLPRPNQKTMCKTVVQIGDSTSVGLDNSLRVPSPSDRMTAQYRRVGAENVYLDAINGRSVTERVGGQQSGLEAIGTELAHGRDGCWIIALGANDAALIAQGNPINADRRIDRVMQRLAGRPVLWPTVRTAGPDVPDYANSHMKAFNAALRRAAQRYPNLRVYDFAKHTDPSWYVDGVHYTSAAMIQRNRLFASALATSFPRR